MFQKCMNGSFTWSASEIWDPAEENLFSASLDASELADMAREADLRCTRGTHR